jgi:hypothetical protein
MARSRFQFPAGPLWWAGVLALTVPLACSGDDTRLAGSAALQVCPTYWVIGARGSGQPLEGSDEIEKMGSTVAAYVRKVAEELPAAETEYLSLPYPAVSVGPGYFASVDAGWQGLQAIIRSRVTECPQIRIGLVGYSQGAHVVNQALHALESFDPGALENVRAALLIADPRADAGQDYHLPIDLFGDPAPAPQHGGLLTEQTLPAAVHSRAVSFCISGDIVCDAPENGFALLAQAVLAVLHDGYRECCQNTPFVDILGSAVANGLLAEPPNRAPRITADSPRVTAGVGEEASNSGDVTDPDGDAVTVSASSGSVTLDGNRWTWTQTVTDEGPQTITITASDAQSMTSVSFALNAGADANRAPVADAGPDETIECTGHDGTQVTLNGTDSSDPDGDPLSFSWTGPFGTATGSAPTVLLPDGAHEITLTVSDEAGASSTDSVTMSIVDTTPPVIESAAADPGSLWPPNHRMVPVTVAVTATDVCSPTVTCEITEVTSNEPVNGPGDGNTAPDWEITGPLTASVRAERRGGGDGRVYTIAIGCSDDAGNTATAQVEVTVPHNR